MNNKKIVDYVMQSPNNTNPAVLESMLEATINSGGDSSSGVKCVYFDSNDMDKYEKTVLNDGDTEIVYVKISDETPTYEEILRGVYAQNGRYITDTSSEERIFVVVNGEMEENAEYLEEFDGIMVAYQVVVLRRGSAELGIGAGTYICNPEMADSQIHFAALIWGFR